MSDSEKLQTYSKILGARLETPGSLSPGAIANVVGEFKKMVRPENMDAAFASAIDRFGNETSEAALSLVHQEIERLNREVKINTNSAERIKRSEERKRELLKKMAVEINGVEFSNGATTPESPKKKMLEAKGKFQNKAVRLQVEIIR